MFIETERVPGGTLQTRRDKARLSRSRAIRSRRWLEYIIYMSPLIWAVDRYVLRRFNLRDPRNLGIANKRSVLVANGGEWWRKR